MPSDGDSFLPRIQSVFYSVFDVHQGPRIVYQVPEGLIAVSPLALPSLSANNSVPPTPSSESPPLILQTPVDYRITSRGLRSSSSNRTLFNFDDISKYVIPPSPLCGRLVICATKRHRIIGFPVELKGKYKRNYFRYNLCFVFERSADLSCYEPIVRKVSRVLTTCEEESGFLSSSQTSPAVHAILEQLYEDLNSYSETSIAIDQFNSIELKIFPFYPNPPEVKDWMVPVALINLSKRIEDNWDLTMVKVCKFIDGTNHVSRIAHLAGCDIVLARQAISHLLYFQVIMTIDIFQYSNMYTLRKSIQWLADETHVKEECGPYVTRPGKFPPDWPRLLHLYSRLKPGKTVMEWMEAHQVHELGIDVRRFTSFGVIKGFLRRIHRYPVLAPDPSFIPFPSSPTSIATPNTTYDPINTSLARRRGKSLSGASLLFPYASTSPPAIDIPSNHANHPQNHHHQPIPRGRPPPIPGLGGSPETPTTPQALVDAAPFATITTATAISATHRARRASAAEKVLEQLRSRDIQKSGAGIVSSPRTSWIHYQQQQDDTSPNATPSTHNYTALANLQDTPIDGPRVAGHSGSRRQSLISPANPPPSPVMSKATLAPVARPRISRSPSVPNVAVQQQHQQWSGLQLQMHNNHQPFPPELVPLLNGEHHVDELAVRFEAGWSLLEKWLVAVGGGQGEGDFGRVSIIFR